MKLHASDSTDASLQRPAFFPGLDGLRALMALWVLVGHVANFMGWKLGSFAPTWAKPFLLTSVPVNVFICLSGFVIFQMLSRMNWTGYVDYLTHRARRILPIYWVAIALSIAMLDFRLNLRAIVPWYEPMLIETVRLQAAEIGNSLWLHVAAHLTLTHGLIPESILPRASESILAPAWSLSLEWQFYVLAPLVFFWVVRGASHFLGLVVVLSLASLLLPFADLGLTPAFLLVSWPYFALGWLSSLCLNPSRRAPRAGITLHVLAAGLTVCVALIMSNDVRATLLSIGIWVAAWLACCAPGISGRLGSVVRVVLGNRHLVATGKRSYSLYLMHVLLLDVTAYVLIRAGALNTSSAAGFLILLLPTLALTLLVTWLTYAMIEVKFMHKAPRANAQA